MESKFEGIQLRELLATWAESRNQPAGIA